MPELPQCSEQDEYREDELLASEYSSSRVLIWASTRGCADRTIRISLPAMASTRQVLAYI